MKKLKWTTADSQQAVHLGFNVFNRDDTVAILRIDDYSAWRPATGCTCDNMPWNPKGKVRPCPECKKAGFKQNSCEDGIDPELPRFVNDLEALDWVLENARKSKICRKAIKVVYGI